MQIDAIWCWEYLDNHTVFVPYKSRFDGDTVIGSCRNWTGAVTNTGYGQLHQKSRFALVTGQRYVHRAAYSLAHEFLNGEDQLVDPRTGKRFDVAHRCDNKLCCEASHLMIASRRENIIDRKWKADMNAVRMRQDLSEDDQFFAEALAHGGYSNRQISRIVNISPKQASVAIRASDKRRIGASSS